MDEEIKNYLIIIIIKQPKNVCAVIGETALFISETKCSSTVQWQVSSDCGKTWTDISGATNDELTFTVVDGQNGNLYRAIFRNECKTKISDSAKLCYSTLILDNGTRTFSIGFNELVQFMWLNRFTPCGY